MTDSHIGGECPQTTNIVIFGAAGDLTKRKLLPALAHMHRWNLIGDKTKIIGVDKKGWRPNHWKDYVHSQLLNFFPDAVLNPRSWYRISERLDFVSGDMSNPDLYKKLKARLEKSNSDNAIFYMAIPPSWYECVCRNLNEVGLSDETHGYKRIVIEKPFGLDLNSAKDLNKKIQDHFNESQIYRIDHYLGKESVQNLMVFRFANAILEPLWNRNFIDHVQISVSESMGIGYRAGYYENAGALRDMIQSHLMQVMALVAMEPPVSLSSEDVRKGKLKVLRSIRKIDKDDVDNIAIRAQYSSGTVKGEPVSGYIEEDGVESDSNVETFAAVKFFIDNWRWQGVPFLLRTGKRLPERVSEICIRFREAPQKLFDNQPTLNNELIFRLQPDEGMRMNMTAKRPGLESDLRDIRLDATYGMDGSGMPEAYETLIHDVLLGNASLFSCADEVELCWESVMPILEKWEAETHIATYPAGSNIIPNVDNLLKGCAGGWRNLKKSKIKK